MKITCSKCKGNVEGINRAGQKLFLFCRNCKLPHDELGNPLFTAKSLADHYNPLQAARNSVSQQAPTLNGVAKTALETAAIQGYLEAYFAGIKDGVLLAFSQEYSQGEPL